MSIRKCSGCKNPGHNIRTCPMAATAVVAATPTTRKSPCCSICKKPGHNKRNCNAKIEVPRIIAAPEPDPSPTMTEPAPAPIAHGFAITCPEGVLDGCFYTQEKRQELYGTVAGGRGSRLPEIYQKAQIVKGTGRPCDKTNVRINWRKNEMIENSQPMRKDDGFDYTENFDGKQVFDAHTVWVNLKSVVGTGGSQTRTLRDECYPFVNAQLDYLLKSGKTDYLFANIFDGDEAASKMKMFHYLLDLPEFASVKKYVYVGDLKGYFAWLKARVC